MINNESMAEVLVTERQPLVAEKLSGQDLTDKLTQIFDLYTSEGIDVRLVGSYGRFASINNSPVSLYGKTELRDIDIMSLGTVDEDKRSKLFEKSQAVAYPFKFDEHFIGKVTERENRPFIRYKDIELEIHPSVLARRVGQLFGVEFPTFDPNTLFHLFVLYGPLRLHDWQNSFEFQRKIKGRDNVLPEFLFEPFHRLNDIRRRKYPNDTLVGNLRWYYAKLVPYDKMPMLRCVVQPARGVVKKFLGWAENYQDQQDNLRANSGE